MKQRLLVSFLALGTLVALNSLPAFGMVTGELKVSVPCEFRVGNTTMPAGRYLIISTDDNEPNLLEIRNESGSPTILVMTEPLTSPHTVTGRSKLVFKQVGKLEYLSQIWEGDSRTRNEVESPASMPAVTNTSATEAEDSHTVSAKHADPKS